MEAVQEENLEDISHEEEAISRRLTSTVARKWKSLIANAGTIAVSHRFGYNTCLIL